MRLLIIQDQLRNGGTERQSILTANALYESGHQPEMLLFRPGGELFASLGNSSFPIHVLQTFDSGVSLWAPGLKKKIKHIAPDVMLCMGRTANCYAGYLKQQVPEIPLVATVRTGKQLLPFHTWSLEKANGIIVNCNWWKRHLAKKGIPKQHLHVIHNPCLIEAATSRCGPARDQVREEMKAREATCVFLNVAGFRPGKRQMDLLAVFKELKDKHPAMDWQLWLSGNGKTLDKCRKWCASAGLQSKVRFLGYQADPIPLYQAADAAISLSTEDSLPNFLIEAQMMGLPVIARDYRGVRETFEPGKSGILVKTNSPPMVVPLVRQLASKTHLREAYSKVAVKTASTRFNRDRQTKKIIELLEQIRARHGGGLTHLSSSDFTPLDGRNG